VTDRSKNKASLNVTGIKDEVPPVVTLTQSPIPNPFSPAPFTPGDDDVTVLRFTTVGAASSRVDVYSKSTGAQVGGAAIIQFTGDVTDTIVTWNGSGQNDGQYRMVVTAVDGHGLTAEVSSEVTIDVTPFTLTSVSITPREISPENADGVNDFAVISYSVNGPHYMTVVI
jgi:hypothetical protein